MRDRAVKPRIGDQTACRFCRADIEYHGKKTGWMDRGGNVRCESSGMREEGSFRAKQKHRPASDKGAA